jgi:hypothetical protein
VLIEEDVQGGKTQLCAEGVVAVLSLDLEGNIRVMNDQFHVSSHGINNDKPENSFTFSITGKPARTTSLQGL